MKMSNSTTKQSNISFLMPIQDRINVRGRGVVVFGTVLSGAIDMGQEVAVIGNGRRLTARVDTMELFRRPITRAQAGENVGILLLRMKPEEFVEGMAVVVPSNTSSYKTFKATITLLQQDKDDEYSEDPEYAEYLENSVHLFVLKGRTQIELLLWNFHRVRASISQLFASPDHTTPLEQAVLGDTVYATIDLPTDVVLYDKFEFAIMSGHLKIATAVVTEIIG